MNRTCMRSKRVNEFNEEREAFLHQREVCMSERNLENVDLSEALKLLEGLDLNDRNSMKSLFKEDGKISVLEYEALVVARSTGEFVEKNNGFVKCNAVRDAAAIRALKGKSVISIEERLSVLRKLTRHVDPFVRAVVFEEYKGVIGELRGQKDALSGAITELYEAVKDETDVYALTTALSEFANVASDRRFRDWNLSMMANADARVRREASSNGSWCFKHMQEDEKEPYHAAYLKLLADENDLVASSACELLPDMKRADDVAELGKVLSKAASIKDTSKHAACIKGLTKILTTEGPGFDAAYEVELNYFRTISKNAPSNAAYMWTPNRKAFEQLSAKHGEVRAEDFVEAFKSAARAKELTFPSRMSAIERIAELGTKGDVESVHDSIVGDPSEKSLQQAYDRAIKKAP